MSNFNDVLSESVEPQDVDPAAEKRKKREELFADLDRMPATQVSNSPHGPIPTTSESAVTGVATTQDGIALRSKDPAVPQNTSLVRADSSMTPLVDAGLVDETGIAMSMCGFGSSAASDPFGQQLCALAGFHAPTERSFEQFFRNWFETEHFPVMSEDLKRELVYRAKAKGLFSGLSSQVKKWAMANTDARLQADVWHSYFTKNAPPQYKVYGCVRIAFMNLGAVAKPAWMKFYGLPASPEAKDNVDQWVLMPWASHAVDISALLDELDGRGGMTALLAAAS